MGEILLVELHAILNADALENETETTTISPHSVTSKTICSQKLKLKTKLKANWHPSLCIIPMPVFVYII